MQMEQITKDKDYKIYLEAIKTSDDDISQVIFSRKELKVKELIMHKQEDYKIESLKKSRTIQQYNETMDEIVKATITKINKSKKHKVINPNKLTDEQKASGIMSNIRKEQNKQETKNEAYDKITYSKK